MKVGFLIINLERFLKNSFISDLRPLHGSNNSYTRAPKTLDSQQKKFKKKKKKTWCLANIIGEQWALGGNELRVKNATRYFGRQESVGATLRIEIEVE